LSNLRYGSNQLPLFPEERKRMQLVNALDEVNDRFGDFTVTFASLLDGNKAKEKGSYVISPAWRPAGIRNIDVK
jgi:DNA polymerase-4